MIQILLLNVLIIAIAITLLFVRLIFKKNGEFSSLHIHENAGLRKKDIHCVMIQDLEARNKNRAY